MQINTDKIIQELENSLIKLVKTGQAFEIPYSSRIDVSSEMKQAYEDIDYDKVRKRITEVLEEELAWKIVNKVITEMGNDIKNLMCDEKIRADLKLLMKEGMENIMKSVREQ